jgi:hypothetical protein
MVTRAELIKELDAMEARLQADADRLARIAGRLGAMDLAGIPIRKLQEAISALGFCNDRLSVEAHNVCQPKP